MPESAEACEIPDHVPPELVRSYPFIRGRTTTAHPHDLIAEIHRGPPIFFAPGASYGVRPAWVPRRLADIQRVSMDNEHFSVRSQAPFAEMIGQTWVLIPGQLDPPDHTRLRAVLNPLFSPRRMALMEDTIRAYARERAHAVRERGQCEFMSEFAFEFPVRAYLDLFGLPQSQAAQFLTWERTLMHGTDPEAVGQATRDIVQYLTEEIEDRRARPRDDLVTFSLEAEVEGRKFDDDQRVGFVFQMFLGGLDTVSANIGLQFRHLAERHDHQAALRGDPALIPDAIDEFLRAYAASGVVRLCVKQTEIAGAVIKPGDHVLVSAYLAGRDPDAYDRPQEVILDRKPKHIGFGFGAHLCIGQHLARRELRIALETFLGEIPEFSIRPGAEIVSSLVAMIEPQSLPLVWN